MGDQVSILPHFKTSNQASMFFSVYDQDPFNKNKTVAQIAAETTRVTEDEQNKSRVDLKNILSFDL